MKERPILFSGDMVRAILEGRKTQTRRVMKPQPEMASGGMIKRWEGAPADLLELLNCSGRGCPYGRAGDRLWVREAWRVEGKHTDSYSPANIGANRVHFGRIEYEASIVWDKSIYGKLRPSIFMPHWASRITLEITSVRVERLQDISEEDARAEGIVWKREKGDEIDPRTERAAKPIFLALWDVINAKHGYGYEVNPWVWVIEFKVVQP